MLIPFFIGVFCFLPERMMAQNPKLKNINSINVGVKHDMLVNIMFTTVTEEYFYAIIKNTKIKKVEVSRIEAKIRKADSVCVEVVITASNAKQVKKLLKQATREFGKPGNKVYRSANTFDWVWSEIKHEHYLESKSMQYMSLEKAELKLLFIPQ